MRIKYYRNLPNYSVSSLQTKSNHTFMNKFFLIPILAMGISFSTIAAPATDSQEARLLRFPATNGTDVVFSYAGDLYKAPLSGGQAQRLTSFIGYEMFAKFSPDGKKIAFTGEYDGSREVYLIPAEGGKAERRTYTAWKGGYKFSDRR